MSKKGRVIKLFTLIIMTALLTLPVPVFAGGSAEAKSTMPDLLEPLNPLVEAEEDVAQASEAILEPLPPSDIPGKTPAQEADLMILPEGLPRRAPARGELVMRALADAYPKLVSQPVYRDRDWAVQVRGEWFYYAEGRLLPEALKNEAASYDPQPFYTYPAELPDWKPLDSDAIARLRASSAQRQARPRKRSQHFFDTLWNASNRQEARDQVKTIKFLGRDVLVHHAILEPIAMVEQRIQAEARRDPKVKQWMERLTSITAWNWRNIADTQTRSNHAYGTAIDCLMPTQRGMETYWLWTAEKNVNWWAVPYTSRQHPPDAVIKAFESYGFVWGGKWIFYDTMHFEYRPEIFILNSIEMSGQY